MRRSKSDPSKYAANYRKISQRQMTAPAGSGGNDDDDDDDGRSRARRSRDDDDDDDDEEMGRLKVAIRASESTWKRGLAQKGIVLGNRRDDDDKNRRNRGRTTRATTGDISHDMMSLLSPELRAHSSAWAAIAFVVQPGSRKKKKSNDDDEEKKKKKAGIDAPPLTPREIKSAKAAYKNAMRKLAQLETRKRRKESRDGLYRELEEHALVRRPTSQRRCGDSDGEDYDDVDATSIVDARRARAQELLLKSSELGKKLTKRERIVGNDDENGGEDEGDDGDDVVSGGGGGDDRVQLVREGRADGNEARSTEESKALVHHETTVATAVATASSAPSTDAAKSNADDDVAVTRPIKQSFSEIMFASLSTLKAKTDTRNAELAIEVASKRTEEEEKAVRLEEEERKRLKTYVPSSEAITISTMRHAFDDANKSDITKKRNVAVQRIDRPASIENSRYDLPVSSMEYEIIDAVRSNDCTILCGETGSGKSTQVPQFLYEAGFGTSSWWQADQRRRHRGSANGGDGGESKSTHLLIGITQPRRVAAVSTAKRVCFEMGCGDGQSISNDNLVAYQTRYETAGLGKSTRVKFMTDGILLQEIQSDLLLRKYGAIVIDEAHERNLNTDVLLGLLSLALPLRRKAAEEGSLPPLKLVIMSATLRVEDFVNNDRLFPEEAGEGKDGAMKRCFKPALVTVPGRTHPLDPNNHGRKMGGAAVEKNVQSLSRNEVHRWPLDVNDDALGGFRDMDDDEVDGDLFQKEEDEDDYDDLENEVDTEIDLGIAASDDGDKRPRKVLILPLYSMLSADEQAKVFSPVPDDTRLIVVATNIAETSITIPVRIYNFIMAKKHTTLSLLIIIILCFNKQGISYVVDCGRQKCRNYHAGTGVASYDVMWISKAAADQRAGRAGRTGPGHCYRMYSSSVYSRYLDDFALPEVLTRPLEDIVLTMKAMHVSNVTSFPFPTPPEQSQINAAVRLLANLGCVDISRVEEHGGDGKITPLGAAVAQLPLGVRYGKMLLVAAQAKVLDYAIALVAALSETTPFVNNTEQIVKEASEFDLDEATDVDAVDLNHTLQRGKERKHEMKSKWIHQGGDVLAVLKAVGAYAYASRGARGSSEKLASRLFCEENGLHLVVMQRIAKMRLHLCKLARTRLPHAGGIAAETGKYLPSMPPPTRIQECLLRQVIASGLLDNIARRAPPGVLAVEFSGIPRSAYICGNSKLKEPLFIDNNSTVQSTRPEWVCFDSIVRKTKKDGTSIATMQKVTPIDAEWIATLCHGSSLMIIGSPLATPAPRYIKEKDSIQCAVGNSYAQMTYNCVLASQYWHHTSCFILLNVNSGTQPRPKCNRMKPQPHRRTAMMLPDSLSPCHHYGDEERTTKYQAIHVISIAIIL
ncbi:hypothetical protein ACHAW5_002061 [Stephanodiscus triporus]|uniref:RNA helicase n=1 Tax=Stephanodiscus triporus TaxID=2934178 RepID=A0ABD3NPB0_9STRA